MQKRPRSEDGNPDPVPVPSLVEHCSKLLTGGSCDWQQLENLPQPMLVSLLQRCAAQRDELQARCDAQGTQLQQLQERAAEAYYVSPPFCGKRLGTEELGPWPGEDQKEEQEHYTTVRQANQQAIKSRLEGIKSKWRTQPIPDLEVWDYERGNPKYPTTPRYSLQERRFELVDRFGLGYYCYEMIDTLFCRVISSALLLYRACCLFEVEVNTSDLTDRYKCVWTVNLWHARTGRKLVLDEHKGAAAVHLQWPTVEDKQLSSDFLELIDLLCGDLPHTYDYVVAGSVA